MAKDHKILIVDDDKIVRLILSDTLELDGFKNIFTAVNGAEGLRLARKHHPALVITDMMMPEMDGFKLVQEMKNDETLRAIPVIVLTSREEMRDLIRMTEAEDFIVKPFERENVLETVRRVLSRIPRPDALKPKSANASGDRVAELIKPDPKDKTKISPGPTLLHEKIKKILKEE